MQSLTPKGSQMIRMNAKFKSTCECGHVINAGDNILFFPAKTRRGRGRAFCTVNCTEESVAQNDREGAIADAVYDAMRERLADENLAGVYDGAPNCDW